MKSPADLRALLRRQWESASYRETRLLGMTGAWPLVLAIGNPSPNRVRHDIDAVKRHLDSWRQVNIGEVLWKSVRYRHAADPIDLPVIWKLDKPTQWIEAIGDPSVREEFQRMAKLVEQTASIFHSVLIRKRALWINKPVNEVIQAARLTMELSPGCANGRPLRALTIAGIDTKFFERHGNLIITLLDARFDGEVGRIGLENFLGALRESDHWLLVIDLDGNLLPFAKIRVRSSDLLRHPLPGRRLLIVENETCQHQLPVVPQTIAVLGAGLDLHWTQAEWISTRSVGYWGDIDTWGLLCLAKTRSAIKDVSALLMSEALFDRYAHSAVPEPVVADATVPVGLDGNEARLYQRLLNEKRGRLEQEFLPTEQVQQRIIEWATSAQ